MKCIEILNISTFLIVRISEKRWKSLYRALIYDAHTFLKVWTISFERVDLTSTHISHKRHAGMRKMNSDESHVYLINVGRQFSCERVFVPGMLFYENI